MLLLLIAGGGMARAAGQATLTATPNPVVFTDSNAYETFTGCGYDPAVGVTIVVGSPTAYSWFGGPADSDGCIDITWNGFITGPGTYDVAAYQELHTYLHQNLMAQTSFEVVA